MQKHSKVYTGHKGTNFDTHEIGMPDGQIREKRNTRMTGSNTSVSSYIEGHSDTNLLLDISNVLSLVLDETKLIPQTTYTLSFTLDFTTLADPEAISVSFLYESLESAYNSLAKAISETDNYIGSTIGNEVLVAYNHPDITTTNYGSVTISNVVSNIANVFTYTEISASCADLYPLSYWSLNNETVLLTVVPTQDVVQGNDVNSLVQIWLLKDGGNGTFISKDLKYNNNLNYVLTKKPIMKAIIENGCIHRVYITEGRQPLRSFNISNKKTFAVPPETASVTPQSVLPSIEVIGMEDGGLLPTGAVQYTYRIIGVNGSISVNAPLSNVIYLPPGAMTERSFLMYGDEPETISNKQVTLRLDGVDIEYDRIQIIAVYRQAEFAITDIEVIYDGIIETGELTVIHSRKGDGTPLTVGELLLDNKVWDIAETLEIHENHLLAADITGKLDTLNVFDAILRQYDELGNTYTQRFNPNPALYRFCKDESVNIFGNNPKWIHGGQSDGWENGNGVKMWYHIDEAIVDEGYRHRGGGYSTDTDIEDMYGVDDNNNGILTRNFEPGRAKDPKVSDLHYGGYVQGSNNPLMGSEYAGYQQGETYRIGMVFTKNGKDSQVIFLGDFKIPDYEDVYVEVNKDFKHNAWQVVSDNIKNSFALARHEKYNDSSTVKVRQWSRSVKMRFDVRLSDEVKAQYDGFKFVRCERRDGERSVFGQGIMHQVIQYYNHDVSLNNQHRFIQGRMEGKYGPSPWSKYIHNSYNKDKWWMLSSPDQIFDVDQYTFTGGDELYLIADLEQYRHGIDYGKVEIPGNTGYESRAAKANVRASIYGIKEYKNPATYPSRTLPIENGFHVNSGATIPNSALGLDASFINESRGPAIANNGHSLTGQWTLRSTQGTIFQLKNPSGLQKINDKWSAALVEIRRNIPNQYGGKTEFALSNAQWIDMGSITPLSNGNYNLVVGGGDIYANLVNFTKYDDSTRESKDYYAKDFKEANNSNTKDTSENQFSEAGWSMAIPCNSLGNYAFGHGEHWGGGSPSFDYITSSTHLFNKAFMAKNDIRRYIYLKETEICQDVHYYGTIAVSRSKINGEQLDKWLQFPAFDFFEVDLSLGKITHIISQKTLLWVVQESGIGILSFDPLSVSQTQDGAEIQILAGTGTKIRKLQYISKQQGSRHRHFRLEGKDGTYIIDDRNYEIYLFSDNGYKAIAKEKGYGLWLRKMLKNKNVGDMPLIYDGIHGHHDSEHEEIVIQIDQA